MSSSLAYIHMFAHPVLVAVITFTPELLKYHENLMYFLNDSATLGLTLACTIIISIMLLSMWILHYGIVNESFLCLKLCLAKFYVLNIISVTLNAFKGYGYLDQEILLTFSFLRLLNLVLFFVGAINLWFIIENLRIEYGFRPSTTLFRMRVSKLKYFYFGVFLVIRIVPTALYFVELVRKGGDGFDSVYPTLFILSQIVHLIDPFATLTLLNKENGRLLHLYVKIKLPIFFLTSVVYILFYHNRSVKMRQRWVNPYPQIQGVLTVVILTLETIWLKMCTNIWVEKGRSETSDPDGRISGLLNKYVSQFPKVSGKKVKVGGNEEDILGEGEFGEIRRGSMVSKRNNICVDVAVKFLKNRNLEWEETIPTLLSEVKFLHGVGTECKYLVKFYGVLWGYSAGALGIVMEFCSLGSLQTYLRIVRDRHEIGVNVDMLYQNCQFTIDTKKLTKWAFQIASAMSYLSNFNIVHADLATRNVLLDENEVAKVTDFGMSLRLYNYQVYARSNQTIFPWRWMAPEALADLRFSPKSDVWAYGVLLWELYSCGNIPWPCVEWTSAFVDRLKDGVVLEKPLNSPELIYNAVMLACWRIDAADRPTFQNVIEMLKTIQPSLR